MKENIGSAANIKKSAKKRFAIVTIVDNKEDLYNFMCNSIIPVEFSSKVQMILLDRTGDSAAGIEDMVPQDAAIQNAVDEDISAEDRGEETFEDPEDLTTDEEPDTDAESIDISEKSDEKGEDIAFSDNAGDEDQLEVSVEVPGIGEDEPDDSDDAGNVVKEELIIPTEEEYASFSVQQAAEWMGWECHVIPADISNAEAYNRAFSWIRAKYVCFTNTYVYYSQNAIACLDGAVSRFPKEKMAVLNVKGFNGKDRATKISTAKLNLDTGKNLILFPYAYFYSLDLIGETRFEDCVAEESELVFLLHMMQKTASAALAKTAFAYYTEELSADPKSYAGCRDKEFYIESLEQNYLPILESYEKTGPETLEESDGEEIPLRFKRAMINLIYFKVFSNYNARDKFVLIGDEIDRFFESVSKVLQYVDDSLIMGKEGYQQYKIPFTILNLFMYLKHHGDMEYLNREFYFSGDQLFFRQAEQKYNLKSDQKVTIQAITPEKDTIRFDGFFGYEMLYEFAPDALYAMLGNKKVPLEHLDMYAFDKAFGISVNKKYTFMFRLPKKDFIKNGAKLSFCLELGDKQVVLPISFNKPASRLNEKLRCSYWYLDEEHYIKYINRAIVVAKGGTKRQYMNELALLNELRFKAPDNQLKDEIIQLRMKYFFKKKSLAKKRIWLYFDKLYKGGDNGEYQFRHDFAKAKEDGVECYYIVNGDAPCYKDLKREFGDHILRYGTKKCKLYALAAETVVATGPEIIEFVGFNKQDKDYFRDLFNANLVCIAHGVTIQKNANVQNRLFDNTMFYTTSSKYEVAHIKQPVYGYDDDQIALTGMARFDGLKNNDQKQILITPTWRINLVSARSARNAQRGYFSAFKNSDYFRIYNGMINDKRLIESAKKNGYRIIFLLHPLMSSQIDDYDRNDYVELVQATGDMSYEKILTESSLMITDYSGIHYDFGYMRKPIIYYQPKEIPARFEEGGMIFKTMGFGPLTTEYEEAIDLICHYMENGCVLEDEYKKRADDFFAFDDYNNCSRIHDAIHAWVKSRKQK